MYVGGGPKSPTITAAVIMWSIILRKDVTTAGSSEIF